MMIVGKSPTVGFYIVRALETRVAGLGQVTVKDVIKDIERAVASVCRFRLVGAYGIRLRFKLSN